MSQELKEKIRKQVRQAIAERVNNQQTLALEGKLSNLALSLSGNIANRVG